MNEVLCFINRFKESDPAAMEEAFTRGNCYWFAQVLKERFEVEYSYLVYNPITGHFARLIHDGIYDITGKIDNKGFVSWYNFCQKEPIEAERIYRQCIRLEVTP